MLIFNSLTRKKFFRPISDLQACQGGPDLQGAASEGGPDLQGAASEGGPDLQGAASEGSPDLQGVASEGSLLVGLNEGLGNKTGFCHVLN